MSVLCAEVDAHISALSSEWLGVLKSMCCTSAHGLGFDDLHGAVNVSELVETDVFSMDRFKTVNCIRVCWHVMQIKILNVFLYDRLFTI